MGRPTEVSDAPAPPSTGGSWDLRSRAWVSGTAVEEGAAEDTAVVAGDTAAVAEDTAAGVSAAEEGATEQAEPVTKARAAAPRAPEIAGAAPARKLNVSRRGPADPVRSLMHRHRELCERAVDPLEIAAGLEAHGVTDRAAARYRHRDVFSLAEELFARVPAVAGEPATGNRAPERDTGTRAAWSLRALVPGAACIATAGALRLTEGTLGGQGRLAIAVTGALVALVGLALSLRSGPCTPWAAPRGPPMCTAAGSSDMSCTATRCSTKCSAAAPKAPGRSPPHRCWGWRSRSPRPRGARTSSPYTHTAN